VTARRDPAGGLQVWPFLVLATVLTAATTTCATIEAEERRPLNSDPSGVAAGLLAQLGWLGSFARQGEGDVRVASLLIDSDSVAATGARLVAGGEAAPMPPAAGGATAGTAVPAEIPSMGSSTVLFIGGASVVAAGVNGLRDCAK
jgi:hypothetical protein